MVRCETQAAGLSCQWTFLRTGNRVPSVLSQTVAVTVGFFGDLGTYQKQSFENRNRNVWQIGKENQAPKLPSNNSNVVSVARQ